MPTPLKRYVRSVVGPCTVVARHRTSGPQRVVEVRDREGTHWFGKRVHVPRLWQGELDGYAWWGETDVVPRLHHRSEDLRAMVVTALPGRPAADDDPEVYARAGTLLRRLHDERPPVRDDGWLRGVEETLVIDRARVPAAGEEVDEPMVDRCLARLRRLAEREDLPSVPTHGDFLPHNWMVDDSGTVRTLDFTEAALRPAAYDLVRLRFGPCWEQPALWEAFLRGYGRRPTAPERRLVAHLLVLNAVLAVGWGATYDESHVLAHGREVLARASRRTGAVRARPTPRGRTLIGRGRPGG